MKIYCNAQMNNQHIIKHCKIDESSSKKLASAINKLGLSARAFNRILKIARTITEMGRRNFFVDENQIRSLYDGGFIQERSNLILVGGTGTGKTHLAIAIAAHAVRKGYRARFYNLVDLANDLEQEKVAGKGGKLVARLARFDLVILDELGYLPFSKNGSQLLFHLISRLYEQTPVIITTNLTFGEWL